MRLRRGSDAILVGINTILADDPNLTLRPVDLPRAGVRKPGSGAHRLRRIVLDAQARTPLTAKVVSDDPAGLTLVVVSQAAPVRHVDALQKRVRVLVAPDGEAAGAPVGPAVRGRIHLPWLMRQLGSEGVTSLLVEGGGEVNASFLMGGLAHRVAFFYAPKILGGRASLRAVAGAGARSLMETRALTEVRWRKVGVDWVLTAAVG